MTVTFRKYNPRKDRKAVHRIWQECGWISDEKRETEALTQFVQASSAWVMDVDGSAEAISIATPGGFLHTRTELSLSAITAVTTSRIGRNQGAASGTLSRLLAEQAAAGAQVSGLGIFEQGFYDRLGYGNGTYEHWVRFDPAWLVDLGKPRVPVRLGVSDWQEIHEARLQRRRRHGAVSLLPAEITKSEMEWHKTSFGLGYRDAERLTHFLVAHCVDVEEGPYIIDWMVYRTIEEFRELIALIRGLGDQVRYLRLHEPRDIQLQSLMRRPFQLYQITTGAKQQSRAAAVAYWQLRILDVPGCIAAVETDRSLSFNLSLSDPLETHLPPDAPWSGCGGDYTVHLGASSSAVPGHARGLPVLSATVNDLSRFWMGSATAEVLAGLGSFRGERELIAALDEAHAPLPPAPDWDY